MSKPFKTIDEQIELLKSRGLKIVSIHRFKIYLQKYNYHNFINGYNDAFMINFDRSSNKYITGVESSNIIDLFNFDRTLSGYLLTNLQNIERQLSSALTYILGQELKQQNVLCCTLLNFHNYHYQKIFKIKNDNELNELYNNMTKLVYRRDDKLYNSYFDKKNKTYKFCEIPIWSLSLSWCFGDLLYIFSLLTDNIKYKIIRFFTKLNFDIDTFTKTLNMLKTLRNRVAHNNVIFNYKYTKNLKAIKRFMVKNNINFNKSTNINIGNIVNIIDKFLPSNSQLSDIVNKTLKKKIENNKDFLKESKDYIKFEFFQ